MGAAFDHAAGVNAVAGVLHALSFPTSSTEVATYDTVTPPAMNLSTNEVVLSRVAARLKPPLETLRNTLYVTGCVVAGWVHVTWTVDPVTAAVRDAGAATVCTTSTLAVAVTPTTVPSAAVATARTWCSPWASPVVTTGLAALHPAAVDVAGIVSRRCHADPTSVSTRACTAPLDVPDALTNSDEPTRMGAGCAAPSTRVPLAFEPAGAPAATTTGLEASAGGAGSISAEATAEGGPVTPAPMARTRYQAWPPRRLALSMKIGDAVVAMTWKGPSPSNARSTW